MASHPEFEPQKLPIEVIPDTYEPSQIEAEQGIQGTATQHTNVPQVSDHPAQQIIPLPMPQNPAGPSVTLPADPGVLTKQSHGNPNDSSTWRAWFWLRVLKRAIANKISVLIGGQIKNG